MPLLHWQPDMSVGVEALDEDHRCLFALINKVFDAIEAGTGTDILDPLFTQLTDYVRDHFQREEEAMAQGHFPGLAAHRAEHHQLSARVQDLANRFQSGTDDRLNPELLVLFKTWLISHIRISDFQYKPYVMGVISELAGKTRTDH